MGPTGPQGVGMNKKRMFWWLVAATVTLALVTNTLASANTGAKVPRRLQVDDTVQNFDAIASPASYTTEVACRGCLGLNWYAKNPNHTKRSFDGDARHRSLTYLAARGSVCPDGARGWAWNHTFPGYSKVGGAIRHILTANNMEILWCAKNNKVVRGSQTAIPTNHCGKGTVDAVYGYDSCSIDRGTLYLSRLHVWEDFRWSYDLKLTTIRLEPQIDFHVYADGRIAGVFDPG